MTVKAWEFSKKFLGVASAKPVPFVSTLKKAGGAGPQRGSKGEEVTPVPGGGGEGGEVRKEPEAPTITRRAKSTNPSPSVLTLCVCSSPKCPCSLAPTSLALCRLSTALHILLTEAETTPAMLPADLFSIQINWKFVKKYSVSLWTKGDFI